MTSSPRDFIIRATSAADFPAIIALSRRVYPGSQPWSETQLASHLRIFPEGQFVAVDVSSGALIGMAASLIVLWNDYDADMTWRDFTDSGMFTNHDVVNGRTLYGAEIMVDPEVRGRGVGSALYAERERLVSEMGLRRIRAGARLRDYHLHADNMEPEAYVDAVIRGELTDRTLTFQLRRGFKVLSLVTEYLRHDPESLGHAAVIEWLPPSDTG